jgi:pimeloyl-ACP methyl ester carboxylesterase
MHQNPKLPEQIANQAGADFINWFFEHGSGDEGNPFSEDELAGYASRFTGERATAHFNCYRTMFTVDPPHWAADADRKRDLPTLWVQGEKDPFVNAEWVKLLPLAFEHLRIEVFEGCGHWVPEEQPERLVSTIKGLFPVEGVARGSGRGWRGRRVGACGGVEVFRGWELRRCPPS